MGLAHHWTPECVGALTIEQVALWQSWMPPAEPARVGREEARKLVAARRQRRQAWIRAAAEGLRRPPLAAPAPSDRWRADRPPALPSRRRDPAQRGARTEIPEIGPPARPARSNDPPRNDISAEKPGDERSGPAAAVGREQRESHETARALEALAAQLERLERLLSRGAPLGP